VSKGPQTDTVVAAEGHPPNGIRSSVAGPHTLREQRFERADSAVLQRRGLRVRMLQHGAPLLHLLQHGAACCNTGQRRSRGRRALTSSTCCGRTAPSLCGFMRRACTFRLRRIRCERHTARCGVRARLRACACVRKRSCSFVRSRALARVCERGVYLHTGAQQRHTLGLGCTPPAVLRLRRRTCRT
jgi:hypothetical protein